MPYAPFFGLAGTDLRGWRVAKSLSCWEHSGPPGPQGATSWGLNGRDSNERNRMGVRSASGPVCRHGGPFLGKRRVPPWRSSLCRGAAGPQLSASWKDSTQLSPSPLFVSLSGCTEPLQPRCTQLGPLEATGGTFTP